MAMYTKEISRSLVISEGNKGYIKLMQRNERMTADIVLLGEDEAIELYRFLHRKFGGQ